ncbi:AAA family ATPase [Enterococcus canis]|uniref:AAA family ATPase n=1 Tax=Enterococcus canis TaxID=214095 RepID=UPI000832A716|nr:AAA family ATPase [Enterococcus canis]
MKILSIEITGFGKWQQYKLDFSTDAQLIYGLNEAGKSTIYAFIETMLFGFPNRGKRKRNYQPYDGAAFGGSLTFQKEPYGLVRIERFKEKDRGRATVTVGEQTGDEKLLQRILAPLTRELFQQVFTFQQEQLWDLQRLQAGDLERALYALGISGSQDLLQVRDGYLNEAQQFYKRKGSQPPLNQKLKEWQQLRTKIQEKEKGIHEYQALLAALERVKAELDQMLTEEAQVQQKLTLNKQQQLNFPLLMEWQELQQQEYEAPLSDTLVENLTNGYQEYDYLTKQLAEAEASLEKQSGLDQHSARYYFYLEQEEAIKAFLAQRLSFEKKQAENGWLQNRYQELGATEAELRARWQWQVEPVPFTPEELAFIEQLQEQETELLQAQQQTQSKAYLLAEQQQQVEAELENLENRHPELLGGQQQRSWLLPGLLAVGSLVGMVLLPNPWRFLMLVGLVIAGLLAFKKTGQDHKETWQTLLTRLDSLQAEQQQVSLTQQDLVNQLAEQQQALTDLRTEKHLGTYPLASWLTGTEVTYFHKIIAEREQIFAQLKAYHQAETEVLIASQFLTDWLPLQDKSVAVIFEEVQDFHDEMEKIRFAQEHHAHYQLTQQIKGTKRNLKELAETLKPQLATAGIAFPTLIPERLQAERNRRGATARKEQLSEQLQELFHEPLSEAQLAANAAALDEQLRQLQASLQGLRREEQKLLYHEKVLLQDGTLAELYQQQAELETEIQELAEIWQSALLAAEILLRALDTLSEAQLPKLLAQASTYFRYLTDRYQQVFLEEDQFWVTDGQRRFSLLDLSTGTRDQFILALRLAFIALHHQATCPVIIDDGWLHYDHERKGRFVALMQELAQKQQVICFSSDQEMVSYYQQAGLKVLAIGGKEN